MSDPSPVRRYPDHDQRPDMLPPDVALVGRDDDLLKLRNHLNNYEAAYKPRRMPARIFIYGVAGVGKSAVGARFAHMLAAEYPAGALYTDLNYSSTDNDPLNVPQILRTFLLYLGYGADLLPQDPVNLQSEFIRATDRKKVIVFLDNARDYQAIENLLPRSSTCLLIVTSQERLDQNIPSLELQPLADDAALSLFTSIAPSRTPRDEDSKKHLTEVLKACVGLPIAIIILAARLRDNSYTLSRILADLSHNYTQLKILPGPSQLKTLFGPRYRRIVACFRVGYDSLTEGQALLFRRLGVVIGESFDVELGCFLGDLTPDEARLVLEQLRDLQLIQPTQDPDFFTVHSLLKDFAKGQLSEVEASDQMQRVLVHYCDLATQKDFVIRSVRPLREAKNPETYGEQVLLERNEALEWMEKQHLNLVAAVECACRYGEASIAWKTCRALAEFFDIRGKWESWWQTHDAASDVVPSQSIGFGYVSYSLGRLHGSRHNWPDAINCYRIAIAIFKMHDDQPEVGRGLRSLGDAYRYSRNWDAAKNCFLRSLAILKEAGEAREVAITKRSLAAIHRVRGEFEEGLSLCHEAIATLEAEGDDRWIAASRLSLADLHLDYGDEDARPLLDECLRVFTIFRDSHWLTLTRRSLADAMREHEEYENALAELVKCRDSVRRERDVLWEGEVLHSMGLVYLAQSDPPNALSYFTEALAKFRQSNDILWVGRTLVSVGRVAAEDGRVDDAKAAYYEAWPLLVEQGAIYDLGLLEGFMKGVSVE